VSEAGVDSSSGENNQGYPRGEPTVDRRSFKIAEMCWYISWYECSESIPERSGPDWDWSAIIEIKSRIRCRVE